MKKLTIFFFFSLLFISVAAQKNKHVIDSIENIIKIQKDSLLVNSLSELIWQYRLVNRDKSIDYGKKAISLGKKINYQKGLAQAYNDLGIIYYDKEKYDSSILLYNEALKIRQSQKDDLGIAKLYNKIGIVYQKQGKFSDALFNQQNALILFKKTNNDIGVSYSLNNIGILQQNLGRYEEALEYQNQSIAIKKKLNDKAGLLQSYINAANIYKIQEEYNKAEDYYVEAVALSRQLGNKEYLSNGLNNLGDLYTRKKEFAKAELAIKESLELRTSTSDTKGTSSSLNNLGEALIQQEKLDTAKIVLTQAEQLAENGINTKPELIMIYQTFSKLYEKKLDITNSLNYYKKYAALKDSVFNDDLSTKFSELETKFKTAEKEKLIEAQKNLINLKLYENAQQKLLLSQNELLLANNQLEINKQNETILEQRLDSSYQAEKISNLNTENKIKSLEIYNQKLEVNKKNILLTVTIAVAALLLLLGFSYYRRYKLKKEKQLQEEVFKQQEIATKAVIAAEENERKRIAGDLHDSIGQMMSAAKMNLSAMEAEIPFATEEQRNVYKKALSLVDDSCKEVRIVSHNMMPNALLKSGLATAVREFLYQIDSRVIKIDLYTEGLSEKIDTNTETVLYRVIQECVNNVIKHANANHLDISLVKDEDGIAVTIEDNGKGFDSNNKNNFNGIGLKNIQTRIQYLQGTVEWNSAIGKGTLVAIHIPC